MSSPIEISDRAKSRLEALQATIRDATGREVSQQEIVERVVERGYDSKAELVNSFQNETDRPDREMTKSRSDDEWEPPTDAEVAAFFAGTSDWGFETSEDEIDGTLYGG